MGWLPLHHHSFFLAAQGGARSADCHHVQIWAVLVLEDHVHDATERRPGILVDGGPHIWGG